MSTPTFEPPTVFDFSESHHDSDSSEESENADMLNQSESEWEVLKESGDMSWEILRLQDELVTEIRLNARKKSFKDNPIENIKDNFIFNRFLELNRVSSHILPIECCKHIFDFVKEDFSRQANAKWLIQTVDRYIDNAITPCSYIDKTHSMFTVHLENIPYPKKVSIFELKDCLLHIFKNRRFPMQMSHFCCNNKGVLFNNDFYALDTSDHPSRKERNLPVRRFLALQKKRLRFLKTPNRELTRSEKNYRENPCMPLCVVIARNLESDEVITYTPNRYGKFQFLG